MYRVLIAVVAVSLTISGCKSTKIAAENKYLPTEFSNIHFNMSMEKVTELRSFSTSDVQDDNFRFAVYEKIGRNGIEGAAYYFDAEGDKPLYEIIIIYADEAARDAAAATLLGPPNYKDNTEWMLSPKKGYPLYCWKFKTKLVVAALIPNTEWYNEFNP